MVCRNGFLFLFAIRHAAAASFFDVTETGCCPEGLVGVAGVGVTALLSSVGYSRTATVLECETVCDGITSEVCAGFVHTDYADGSAVPIGCWFYTEQSGNPCNVPTGFGDGGLPQFTFRSRDLQSNCPTQVGCASAGYTHADSVTPVDGSCVCADGYSGSVSFSFGALAGCADDDGCSLNGDGCGFDAQATCSDGGGNTRMCTCAGGYDGTATLDDSQTFGACTVSLSWTIESDDPAVTANFEMDSTSEIKFSFKKTDGRGHEFALYETLGPDTNGKYSCDVAAFVDLSEDGVSSWTTVNEATANGETTFEVDVDVDVATIAGKTTVWTVAGNLATLKVCARVDLKEGSVSVSFLEVPVEITVDLTAGFSIASVDLDRTGTSAVNESAAFDYTLDACQCDADNVGPDTSCPANNANAVAMSQNQILTLCINTLSDEVEILNIQSLQIKQVSGDSPEFVYAIGGGDVDTPDNSGSVGPLTAYTATVGKMQAVKTRLVSKFFPSEATVNIKVIGQALLQFKATGARRLVDITALRSLQSTDLSAFGVTVQLVNDGPTVNANEVSGVEAMLVSTAVLLLALAV